MRTYITQNIHFNYKGIRNRLNILIAKYNFLKSKDFSEIYIDAVLLSNGYSTKEIKKVNQLVL